MKNVIVWGIFIAAALLEIGGDAMIRKGLRGSGISLIVVGFVTLGCYGLMVNIVEWNFSKLLGVYVALFAVMSVIFSRFIFNEIIPNSTWIGICVIVVGGLIIQFGSN